MPTSIRRRRRPRRLFDLGAATARVLAESPYRVALLASSGWSHAFLTAKNHFLWPDTPADRRMYEALRDCDWQTWRGYSGAAVEDSGQQEILNWIVPRRRHERAQAQAARRRASSTPGSSIRPRRS